MAGELTAGVFASGRDVLEAARAARSRGLAVRDAFTPHPVHGMDEALGLAPSRLPAACLALGLTGLVLGFGFQEWVFLVDWPMNIGGKPLNAWPAYIPVTFELTVLFAGVGTALSFFAWRRLRPLKAPLAAAFGATDDKFVLVLEGSGTANREFLSAQGALDVREASGL